MGDWCPDCGEVIGRCRHTNPKIAADLEVQSVGVTSGLVGQVVTVGSITRLNDGRLLVDLDDNEERVTWRLTVQETARLPGWEQPSEQPSDNTCGRFERLTLGDGTVTCGTCRLPQSEHPS